MSRRPRATATLHVVDGPWRVGEFPDPDGFADAVAAALGVERRAEKTALFADDGRRYQLAVRAMGRFARHVPPVGTIDHRGLESIAAAAAGTGRLAQSFHPPWTIASHIEALESLGPEALREAHPLLMAARAAAERGAGYVIAVEPGRVVEHRSLSPHVVRQSPSDPQPAVADALEALEEPSVFERGDRRKSLVTLHAQTVTALRRGDPIPVGAGARHEVVAEVLRMLQGPSIPTGRLRIVYVDGSEGAPFPVGSLAWPEVLDGDTIRLGLMSIRHTELDVDVDGYWFRNRMVSLPRAMGETSTAAFGQSLSLLEDLTSAGITTIQLVHTGYEPAVVGCYHAVRTWIGTGRPPIRVEPLYLVRRRLSAGTAWGRPR